MGECKKIQVYVITMNEDKQERLKACLKELATLLYEEADKSQLTNLEGIEKTVRSQILEYVSPEIALFLLSKQQEQEQVRIEKLEALLEN
jgi:hypothetical protein